MSVLWFHSYSHSLRTDFTCDLFLTLHAVHYLEGNASLPGYSGHQYWCITTHYFLIITHSFLIRSHLSSFLSHASHPLPHLAVPSSLTKGVPSIRYTRLPVPVLHSHYYMILDIADWAIICNQCQTQPVISIGGFCTHSVCAEDLLEAGYDQQNQCMKVWLWEPKYWPIHQYMDRLQIM